MKTLYIYDSKGGRLLAKYQSDELTMCLLSAELSIDGVTQCVIA